MYQLQRIVSMLSRHGLLPVATALAAWYGGSKYGDPEGAYVNLVDGLIENGSALVSGVMGGDEAAPAPAENDAEV